MNKVERVHKKLMVQLPERYRIPIKCFKTTKILIIREAQDQKVSYKKLVKYYTEYFNNSKKATYITTKYYRNRFNKREDAFDICALGGNPIYISLEHALKMKRDCIRFLLLHEIAHNVLGTSDERNCDLFAIRWTRKLNKRNVR